MAKAPERGFGGPIDPPRKPKHPDPKKHQYISFAKSAIRIFASVVACVAIDNPAAAIVILAIGYAVAEVVGVYEELV